MANNQICDSFTVVVYWWENLVRVKSFSLVVFSGLIWRRKEVLVPTVWCPSVLRPEHLVIGLVRHFSLSLGFILWCDSEEEEWHCISDCFAFCSVCRAIVFLGQCLSTRLAGCILVVWITTELVSISVYLLLFYISTCLVG